MYCHLSCFFKMGNARPLFVYYRLFHSTQINIDGARGTRTQGGKMEGADKSTELWWHPYWVALREAYVHMRYVCILWHQIIMLLNALEVTRPKHDATYTETFWKHCAICATQTNNLSSTKVVVAVVVVWSISKLKIQQCFCRVMKIFADWG